MGLGVGDIYFNNKARQDTKRASRAQSRIEERKTRRSTQQQLRQAQKASADIIASSVSQGTGEASATTGGVASVNTQSTNNISFINQIQNAQKQVQSYIESASSNRFKAGVIKQLRDTAVDAASGGV